MFKKEILDLFLKAGFSKEETNAEVDLIFETVAKVTKKDFILNPSLTLSEEIKNKILYIVNERISKREPLQYLLGEAYFMGEKFLVNTNVLIPRPETELLVREALKYIKNGDKILDIGTGSGIITCMIAKLTASQISVTAVDISSAALDIAKENAFNIGVLDKINFVESNIFSNIEDPFDMIVSNPPYIPLKDKENLQEEVIGYEPHQALFANDIEGVEFYKKIIEEAQKYLKPNGIVIFELGINQAGTVQKLFEQNGYKVLEVVKDLSGIERTIVAQHIK